MKYKPSAQTTPAKDRATADAGNTAGQAPRLLQFLGRLEWLLLLTALTLVILVYPLRLQDAWLAALNRYWAMDGSPFAQWTKSQFEPFLSFYHSALLLKGILAGCCMIGFVGVWAARGILAPAFPTPEPARSRSAQGRLAWISVAAFFIWVAASAYWSPTPLLAEDALIWTLMYGLFIFAFLRRGLALEELAQLGVLLMLLGAAVMAIVFLEAFPVFRGKIFLFMIRFDDLRNRYGSLLGHNTAAASFLMMTAFPAFIFMLSGRSRRRRWLSGCYLAALLYSMLILQTRAVWVLFPLLGFFAVRSALRPVGYSRFRWITRALLAIVALGLVSQTIDRPWNPLYMRDSPIAQRMKRLNANSILTDVRPRLNLIGATLVPAHPVIGHGLYAFQYVYSKRQGEYFLDHPDSRLNQTVLRSHMAHNEYLQILIDHGLIGLGLLGWMLTEIARRGWRRRKTLHGSARLLHDAFGWSALGFTLHALVDFPFHIPQLALPGIFCLVAWGACRPSRREMDEPASPEESPVPNPASAPVLFYLGPFPRLVLAGLMLLLVPVFAFPLLIALQADTDYNQGCAYIETFNRTEGLDLGRRVEILNQATRKLGFAVKQMPAHYLAWQRLSEAYWQLGLLWMRRIPPSADRSDARFSSYSEGAVGMLKAALAAINQARQGLDYHYIYWMRAQILGRLDELEPGQGYGRQYRDNLNKTLQYCSAFTNAAYELAEVLARDPHPDMERILELRQRILRSNAYFFGRMYVDPANQYTRDKRYAAAAGLWESILHCNPTQADWLRATAGAELLNGNSKRAMELLDELRARDPLFFKTMGSCLIDAAQRGNWPVMLNMLKHVTACDLDDMADYRVMEIEVRSRLRQAAGTDYFPGPAWILERIWRATVQKIPPLQYVEATGSVRQATLLVQKGWENHVAESRPGILLHLFNDPRSARRAMEERLMVSADPPAINFWLEGFYVGLAQGDLGFARHCLDEADRINHGHPALPDLYDKLSQQSTQK